MPRSSAEERSAAFYRAGKKPPAPPRGMTPAANRIWREIVAGKPIDWFDSGSLPILKLHCENTARANRVSRDLAASRPGSLQDQHLTSAMKTLTAILASSSRQLRLTVQHAVQRKERKNAERGPLTVVRDDRLVGGRAIGNGDAKAA